MSAFASDFNIKLRCLLHTCEGSIQIFKIWVNSFWHIDYVESGIAERCNLFLLLLVELKKIDLGPWSHLILNWEQRRRRQLYLLLRLLMQGEIILAYLLHVEIEDQALFLVQQRLAIREEGRGSHACGAIVRLFFWSVFLLSS